MSSTCSSCGKPSHQKPVAKPTDIPCVNRMSDARSFTDWRPRCDVLAMDFGDNSYAIRQNMIHNATKLMHENAMNAMNMHCGECFKVNETGTMLPESQKQICNKSSCKFVPQNPNGLGLGR